MILTTHKITSAVEQGDIVIDPFDPDQVSTNAYDWRLGDTLRVCEGPLDARQPSEFSEMIISEDGVELAPGNLYLGVTHERTQSDRYAQLINGDRNLGALGVWVHVSAPLGHTGHAIRWTLEICVVRRVRIYPLMTCGKIVFLETQGKRANYREEGEKYALSPGIETSRLYEEWM